MASAIGASPVIGLKLAPDMPHVSYRAMCRQVPFNEAPDMKAREITEAGKEALRSGRFKMVRVNFANPGALAATPLRFALAPTYAAPVSDVAPPHLGMYVVLASRTRGLQPRMLAVPARVSSDA